MKKIFLLITILFTSICSFAQNPSVLPAEGKGCNCGSSGMNISTGFDNSSSSIAGDGSVDDTWKITAYPGGSGSLNAIKTPSPVSSWAPNSAGAAWIVPDKSIQNVGSYDYKFNLNVNTDYKAYLKFSKIGADNDVELFVDGNSKYSSNKGGYAFKAANMIPNPSCLVIELGSGNHTIIFRVKNESHFTGLYVQGCFDLVRDVPVCQCPQGWLSNTSNKDGDITKDGKCKKMFCRLEGIKPMPANGTVIGTLENQWGFTWGDGIYAWGTKENGGAAVCTLNGRVIDWSAYQATLGRGK